MVYQTGGALPETLVNTIFAIFQWEHPAFDHRQTPSAFYIDQTKMLNRHLFISEGSLLFAVPHNLTSPVIF